MKKIYIIFIVILVIVFVFILIGLTSNTKRGVSSQTPKPISGSLEKEYSYLNKAVPGKSSPQDVIKINGIPSSSKSAGSKFYLYYQTPIRNIFNTVSFEGGVESYAIENVFGSYRGVYGDFTGTYGQPDLTLYDPTNSLVWYVFPQYGLGVQTNGKDISKIIYFIPQNKESFINGVGREIGLHVETPRPETLP